MLKLGTFSILKIIFLDCNLFLESLNVTWHSQGFSLYLAKKHTLHLTNIHCELLSRKWGRKKMSMKKTLNHWKCSFHEKKLVEAKTLEVQQNSQSSHASHTISFVGEKSNKWQFMVLTLPHELSQMEMLKNSSFCQQLCHTTTDFSFNLHKPFNYYLYKYPPYKHA